MSLIRILTFYKNTCRNTKIHKIVLNETYLMVLTLTPISPIRKIEKLFLSYENLQRFTDDLCFYNISWTSRSRIRLKIYESILIRTIRLQTTNIRKVYPYLSDIIMTVILLVSLVYGMVTVRLYQLRDRFHLT